MMLGRHRLVVYGASDRADAVLRRVSKAIAVEGDRLTVIRLVAEEPESKGCCDTRSVYWNDVMRGMAREDLARAQSAVEGRKAVELEVLPFSGRHAADAVIREALLREADEIVLTDPRAVPMSALERRRLRRKSPVPIVQHSTM
jgi:hypothetical protein